MSFETVFDAVRLPQKEGPSTNERHGGRKLLTQIGAKLRMTMPFNTLKPGLGHAKLNCKIGLVFEKYELDSERKQQNQDDDVVSTDRHPSTRHKNIHNIDHK